MRQGNSDSILEEPEVTVILARATPKYKITCITLRCLDFFLHKHLLLIFLISKTLWSLEK